MGITDTTSRITYSGDGATTAFTFDFRVFDTDELKVIVRTDSSGAESEKTLTTDYTVVLNSGEGGTVTMVSAPISGETLYIGKDVPETQPNSISVGNLPNATLEEMYDRLTMLFHQLKERTTRSPLFSRSSPSVNKTIAEPVDGELLGWNASGNIVGYSTSTLDTGTLVLDEDNMASDSATAVPTQQSTKAYVDAQVQNLPAVDAISSTTTLTSAHDIVTCDTSGGAFTVTLPTAVGIEGKEYILKYSDSGIINALTVDGDGSETIDGATTTTLNTEGETLRIISDGANWVILDRRIPSKSNDYTPGLTNVTGTAYGTWKRIGDSVSVKGRVDVTGVSGNFTVGLPTGITALAGAYPGDAVNYFYGHGTAFDNSSSNSHNINMFVVSGGTTIQGFVEGAANVNATVPFTWAASADYFNFEMLIPVTGWNG